jgi:hypothetical protein
MAVLGEFIRIFVMTKKLESVSIPIHSKQTLIVKHLYNISTDTPDYQIMQQSMLESMLQSVSKRGSQVGN